MATELNEHVAQRLTLSSAALAPSQWPAGPRAPRFSGAPQTGISSAGWRRSGAAPLARLGFAAGVARVSWDA